MSSDLRVALRIQANAGNSRREIQALERDLRKAGKDGAKALADDSAKATDALAKTGRAGAANYKIIRQAMRDTAAQGSGVFRRDVIQTQGDLKQMGQIGRQAAREVKAELARTAREGTEPLRRSVERTDDSLRRLVQNGGRNLRMLKTIASSARKEFDRIKGLGGTVQGQLAGAGLGVGVGMAIGANAKTDRRILQVGQAASMTPAQQAEYKAEALRVSKAYGNNPDAIIEGGAALLAGGLSPKAAQSSLDAIGQANAVRGADPTVLAGAGMAAKEAYGFNLEDPKVMLEILQKMTVAGDEAKAELENLGDIFNKVGGRASAAGFKFNQTLGLIEALSNVEPNPENLRTMVGNFLTVFNTGTYRDQVSKVTGVEFFNKDKSHRDPIAVVADIKKKYDKLRNDQERARFFNTAFKSMDREAIDAWRLMLTGDRNANMVSISDKVDKSGPIFAPQLAENIHSASGTAGRVKATLRDAMERMAQPLNKGLADLGSYLLDDLNMSGEQLLFGGAAAAVSGYYAGRGAKAGAGALMNKFLGGPETLKNIAVGKVLEEATGVTSVFVTNWPSGVNLGSSVSELPGGSGKNGKGKGGITGKGMGLGMVLGAAMTGEAGDALSYLPFMLPGPLGLAYAFTRLKSSNGLNTDEDRLNLAAKSKLLDENQRTYQEAFYRNRISLLNQNPNQTSDWASTQARRLAQQETGLTAAGGSVDSANNWASGVAGRAIDAGMGTIAAAERLSQLLDKPLVIELRTDSHYIQAEVERRADIQVRRGQ
ncbi:phage tail tape measure protein [Pseudomonas sp. FP833]|uniref:phage tail tape measure protein n=1 Tax=Pseudomonas sp. FP833 TaxID=2954102 RepID=UPI002732CDB8|nr:phage tail tape measure protein [Pseudomonas sp. FP833]WLI50610.1 phage tail tape measure protein [Pseudomonas sp. FP833]